MSTDQATTKQGKIISLGQSSEPSSGTATADEAGPAVGTSREQRCFDVVWISVPGDTWHDTPEDMREATNVVRYRYDLLSTNPYVSKLEVDMQGPADDWFFYEDGDSIEFNIFSAGVYNREKTGNPTIIRICEIK